MKKNMQRQTGKNRRRYSRKSHPKKKQSGIQRRRSAPGQRWRDSHQFTIPSGVPEMEALNQREPESNLNRDKAPQENE